MLVERCYPRVDHRDDENIKKRLLYGAPLMFFFLLFLVYYVVKAAMEYKFKLPYLYTHAL